MAAPARVTVGKSLPNAERKRLQFLNGQYKAHGARLIRIADQTSNL